MKNLAVVIINPEIPPNTGNIIRLCANTGCELHLVKPLGFPLEDNKLKRAGLDYHEYTNLVVHNDWQCCKEYFKGRRMIAIETSGPKLYSKMDFKTGDVLVFGSETSGIPQVILDELDQDEAIIRLPMLKQQRSLNLSNSVAIVVYEAWKQLDFSGSI